MCKYLCVYWTCKHSHRCPGKPLERLLDLLKLELLASMSYYLMWTTGTELLCINFLKIETFHLPRNFLITKGKTIKIASGKSLKLFRLTMTLSPQNYIRKVCWESLSDKSSYKESEARQGLDHKSYMLEVSSFCDKFIQMLNTEPRDLIAVWMLALVKHLLSQCCVNCFQSPLIG